jgi:DNA-binding XRE family transcriptional regulator
MKAQIIEMDGRPAFAVVPVAQWTSLLERLEALQDIADAKAALGEETLPLEFVERRLAGESPLKLWREHRGLTLQALAERAGCTRQMLSMAERGKAAPSAGLLARLAAALGCDMEDLQRADPAGTARRCAPNSGGISTP